MKKQNKIFLILSTTDETGLYKDPKNEDKKITDIISELDITLFFKFHFSENILFTDLIIINDSVYRLEKVDIFNWIYKNELESRKIMRKQGRNLMEAEKISELYVNREKPEYSEKSNHNFLNYKANLINNAYIFNRSDLRFKRVKTYRKIKKIVGNHKVFFDPSFMDRCLFEIIHLMPNIIGDLSLIGVGNKMIENIKEYLDFYNSTDFLSTESEFIETYDNFINNFYHGSELIDQIKNKSKVLITCTDEFVVKKLLSSIQEITKPLTVVNCSGGKYELSKSKNGYIFNDVDKLNNTEREYLFSSIFNSNDFQDKYLIFTASQKFISIYEKYFYNFQIDLKEEGLELTIFLYLLYEKGLVRDPPILKQFIYNFADSVIQLFPSIGEMNKYIDEIAKIKYICAIDSPFSYWYTLKKDLEKKYRPKTIFHIYNGIKVIEGKKLKRFFVKITGQENPLDFKYHPNRFLMAAEILIKDFSYPKSINPINLNNMIDNLIYKSKNQEIISGYISAESKSGNNNFKNATHKLEQAKLTFFNKLRAEIDINKKKEPDLVAALETFLEYEDDFIIGEECFFKPKDNNIYKVDDILLDEVFQVFQTSLWFEDF